MTTVASAWRDWAVGWFAAESFVAGEGTQITFDHTWVWPAWVTLLLIILLTVYVWAIYRRETQVRRSLRIVLAALRCAVFALVIFMLYGWVEHRHRTELPELIVAFDTSESMAIVDTYPDARVDAAIRRYYSDDSSRLGQAKMLLAHPQRGWLSALRERYRVQLVRIGDAARPVPVDAESLDSATLELAASDTSSRLGDSLREIIDRQRGRSTAAIVLLTDGATTEGPLLSEVARYARQKSIPLHFVGLGSEQPPRDVRLSDLLVDEVAFVGDLLSFDVQLHSVGLAGRPAVVRLYQAGESQALAEQTVELPADQLALPVRLSHRPLVEGEWDYTIEVEPLAEEINRDNNRISRRIQVRDATIRVLMVQATPGYEFRFLKSLLSRATKRGATQEKAIELTTILQEADLEFTTQDPSASHTFPVQRDELFAYDVIIFGDANPALLGPSALRNVADFVQERGGGIVFIAGPNYLPQQFDRTPLTELFPFALGTVMQPEPEALLSETFAWRPTPLGQASSIWQVGDTAEETARHWAQVPELRWLLEISEVNTTAMVLAEHPRKKNLAGLPLPVLLMQFVGAGKVIFQATDETYLWARYQGSDQVYARYWLQTIRYLSRSKLLADQLPAEITTDAPQYWPGDAVRVRVHFRDDRLAPAADDGATILVEDERGRRTSVVLRRDTVDRGVFEATLNDLEIGSYRAWLALPALEQAPPPRRFSIEAPRSERTRIEMHAADLRAAASTSGGRFYTIRDALRLPQNLPRGEPVRIESSPPQSIWNAPGLAVLLVGLIVTEWLLRKRVGLL